MKILINCSLPFALTHGGQQIQVERTQAALQSTWFFSLYMTAEKYGQRL
jgi:hypothetical protein